MSLRCLVAVVLLSLSSSVFGQTYNLRVVTDASPDYTDLPSAVRSMTANWPTDPEKCWAVFYWNHKARRQTSPMVVHGMACTDPIRQFNDYGYTMCSTIAGINCSLWHALGYKVKYWDISMHTVSEVEYDGRYHLYDNSMSAVYTLCDGRTIAGVEDIGKEGACEASGGRREPGHIARYHCLNGYAPNSFLTGADCARSLADEYRCFNPNGLKYRYYFFDWDRGHRYVLNVRSGQSYTRHYAALGKEPKHYVPNHGKDPEEIHDGKYRFGIRGNGQWQFRPFAGDPLHSAHSATGVTAVEGKLQPAAAGKPGEVVYKIDGANVIASLAIRGRIFRRGQDDLVRISISATNGMTWQPVWTASGTGSQSISADLVGEVNGSYELLVKIELVGKAAAADARLDDLVLETLTQLNSKTQPKLLLGKNTVYVGAGEQTETAVLWPDLQGEAWKPLAVDSKNMVGAKEHPGYMGALHAQRPKEEAYVIFRLDVPRDLVRLVYGGRLYNRAPKSHIDFLHSFDGGKTWTQSYSLAETKAPWDVIHYETVEQIPAGTRSVLVKYLLNSSEAGASACSLYAVRIEGNYRPAEPGRGPLEVTFRWAEVQSDRTLVERSHTERVAATPHRYTINCGGADHPMMRSLTIGSKGAEGEARPGYSDGRDAGGEKFVPRWIDYGKNLAFGKPYTVSIPSETGWGAGDPEGKKLTDGIVGPAYAGGIAASYGLMWKQGQKPVIDIDLGSPQSCRAFRIHLTGYPFWDALKGQVEDKLEVLTSTDGQTYSSRGSFDFNLRWKDLPVNYMWPDEETATAPMFDLALPQPIEARHVRFVLHAARFAQVSELQVLDDVRQRPFDLRVALPER